MTPIDVPPDQLYRLAATIQDLSTEARQLELDLAGTPQVGRGLQATIEGFLADHRTAAQALSGELEWLAVTIGTVASSWVRLDRSLLSWERRGSGR
jgi:hypothetical protein